MLETVSPSAHACSLNDTFDDCAARLVENGVAAVHARRLWRAIYRDLATDLATVPDFPAPLLRWVRVGGGLSSWPIETARVKSADGWTTKFLLRLEDGAEIETVLMGFEGRHTACLSTQVGCAMGCVFCATGQMGYRRNLRPGEIVAQVLHARRELEKQGEGGALRNLVLMGMGEPLANYDAVMRALSIITDTRGLNIGPSRITISTVGVIPGILRLAGEQRPYHLAVSLHASNEAARSALVPVNQRWPLADLMAACREYQEITGRRIFFEWTLIAGRNDHEDEARALLDLLSGLNAHLNIIPLNSTAGFDGDASLHHAVSAFQRIIRAAGMPCTIRQRRGIDVAAGCGQLTASWPQGCAARKGSLPLRGLGCVVRV